MEHVASIEAVTSMRQRDGETAFMAFSLLEQFVLAAGNDMRSVI